MTETSNTQTHHLSIFEKIVVALCAVGVVAAVWVALARGDIPLFDSHVFEILSDAWTTTATVGVIVALGVAAAVGVFVIVLARATIGQKESTPADH